MAEEFVKVSVDPAWAAHAISEEIQKHAQFCRENPPKEDLVPLWTLVSGGMQITWAILLLERVMKQLLCFDGEKVYKNHNVSQLYANLDNPTKSHIEKAFNAYLMLYPTANVKSQRGGSLEYYRNARKLLAGISSQERYIKWRYPEFYPEVHMDITNVHLILEIANAVSNVLLGRVSEAEAIGSYLVGWRIQASYMNAFRDKQDALIHWLDESGNDPFQIMPADVISSWQDEHGGFLRAFVDYLRKRHNGGVYRHEALNAILNKVVEDAEYSQKSDTTEMKQFLMRVRHADFDLNVLMMR